MMEKIKEELRRLGYEEISERDYERLVNTNKYNSFDIESILYREKLNKYQKIIVDEFRKVEEIVERLGGLVMRNSKVIVLVPFLEKLEIILFIKIVVLEERAMYIFMKRFTFPLS